MAGVLREVAIPAKSVSTGANALDPVVLNQAWNACGLSLDVGSITAQVSIAIERSIDGGVSWLPVNKFRIPKGALDELGKPLTTATCEVTHSGLAKQADTQFRVLIDSDASFSCAGGAFRAG